jgi:Collagen triple helix repeat (20 copies)
MPAGVIMLSRVVGHLRGNIVGYVALFAALGGTSYAAVTLAPGSVTSKALANGAVTNAKLAKHSIGPSDIKLHSLTADDFTNKVLGLVGGNGTNGVNGVNGTSGSQGAAGAQGPTGAQGPAGANGSASIAMFANQSGGPLTAPHSSTTSVPLTNASWTQAGDELDLIAGSATIEIPGSCTGSFGNDLVIDVDGVANTFGVASTAPANGTETIPFLVSELTQPGGSTNHTITAQLVDTCQDSGQDYTVSNAKVDVIAFN